MNYDSAADTLAHIKRVDDLLKMCAAILLDRGRDHDKSKLLPPEKEIFDVCTQKLKTLTYGSEEYKQSLSELRPALEHHYAHNSHHPEHYQNGINDMNLFDVLEMFMDWKAAGERHENGSIWKSIEINADRFSISPQLQSILRNTASLLFS